jgi:hypothetical protein
MESLIEEAISAQDERLMITLNDEKNRLSITEEHKRDYTTVVKDLSSFVEKLQSINEVGDKERKSLCFHFSSVNSFKMLISCKKLLDCLMPNTDFKSTLLDIMKFLVENDLLDYKVINYKFETEIPLSAGVKMQIENPVNNRILSSFP